MVHKIIRRLKQFLAWKKEFCFSCAFWLMGKQFEDRFPPKLVHFLRLQREKAEYNYLNKKYTDKCLEILKHIEAKEFESTKNITWENSTIWICWWDGIENMPNIVRACYNSVQKYKGKYKVVLITKDNFSKYADIPDIILKKFEANLITITHFSDILCVTLLAEHGGIWMDATILVTKEIEKAIPDVSFFTLPDSLYKVSFPKGRWCGFFMCSSIKNHPLFMFMKTFFRLYWECHNCLLDYFLIDLSILITYQNMPLVKMEIDGLQKYQFDLFKLQFNFAEPFNDDRYKQLTANTSFHKLSWKGTYPELTKSEQITNFGFILKSFIKDIELDSNTIYY
jgi:hypothetical protein